MINDKDSQNTFYVLDEKNDIPIVFIHGVGLNHKIWRPQFNVFENTIVAYDILGHGQTPWESSYLSFDNFSRELLILIEKLGMDFANLKTDPRDIWGIDIPGHVPTIIIIKDNVVVKTKITPQTYESLLEAIEVS